MRKSQKRKLKKLEVESKNEKRRKVLPFKKKDGDFTCACSESEPKLERNQSMMEQKVNSSRGSELKSEEFASAARPLIAPTVVVVHVSRPDEVENKRKDLPIIMMEQEIMEAIHDYSIVIVRGATGCGKSTQVPQFLFEAGFGSGQSCVGGGVIGVTQPRVVAARETSKRVAYELGLHWGEKVGYQVRHEKRIGESCAIKFMTDGILLQELKSDFLLKRYSVIILDEVHERSLNTDLLIGMLSRVISSRQEEYAKQQKCVLSGKTICPGERVFPLKLVLMSATLQIEDFINRKLFREPPLVIDVPARQFEVKPEFEKRTDEEKHYVDQACEKVLEIHKTRGQGGILVFVTGQREVESLCQKLRKASRKLIMRTSIGSDVARVPEMNFVEESNMKEISEAIDEAHGESADHQTDRFSFNDEDQFEIDEEADELGHCSYDLETESELEIISDGDGDSLSTPELIDGNVAEVLGDNGISVASLKATFNDFASKTSLDSNSSGKQRPNSSVTLDTCSNQSNLSMGKKRGEDGSFPFPGALHVLPLYAMLSAEAQQRVLKTVKEGERIVVVATNVAETSLTIPEIKYVVDTGKEKVKDYNSSNGMETYKIKWISKASAMQRAGRAGRTGPGHCFHLYSSAAYEKFRTSRLPEISRVPLDGVVLFLKSMVKSKVSNFPFPTPPEAAAVDEAVRCLKALEALDRNERLTPLGKAMAYYPLRPRHSRMLLAVIQIMSKKKSHSRANLVLAYAVAAAAALSCSNPFVRQFEESHTNNHDSGSSDTPYGYLNQEKLVSREKISNTNSDALSRAYALQCYELSKSRLKFCNDNALHPNIMEEISKLRKQLLRLFFDFQSGVSGGKEFSWIHGGLKDVEHDWRVYQDKKPLSVDEEKLLCQAICAGWADRVAKRIRSSKSGDRKFHAVGYKACLVEETVYLDCRSSVSTPPAPEFLVYSELIQTSSGPPYMHGVTRVEPEWLVEYAPSSLSTSSADIPYYSYVPRTDQVVQLRKPSRDGLPMSESDQFRHRVKAFAYALLAGQVLPCFQQYRQYLADPPESVLKSRADCSARVCNLVEKLTKNKIDSRDMLRQVWNQNRRELFLYQEILNWFQKSTPDWLKKSFWVSMLREVGLELQNDFPTS